MRSNRTFYSFSQSNAVSLEQREPGCATFMILCMLADRTGPSLASVGFRPISPIFFYIKGQVIGYEAEVIVTEGESQRGNPVYQCPKALERTSSYLTRGCHCARMGEMLSQSISVRLIGWPLDSGCQIVWFFGLFWWNQYTFHNQYPAVPSSQSTTDHSQLIGQNITGVG